MDKVYDTRGSKGSFGYYFFRLITEFGYLYIVGAVILLAGIIFKFNYKFIILASGTIATYIVNSIIKLIIQRDRPDLSMRQMTETSSSFPSGHSITAFFVYGFLIYIICRSKYKKINKIIICGILASLILIVGLSRIILGMHFLTDVTGGYLLGGIFVICVSYIYDKVQAS